jgi:C4-dicarboxylate-specific signal transduction histidine kinase
MDTRNIRQKRFWTRRTALVSAALAMLFFVGWSSFELSLSSAIRNADEQTNRRLALFDRTLSAIIERFHYLPATVAEASEVRILLRDPTNPDTREITNGYLSRLNNTAGSTELFVLDLSGKVIASSNWWAYDSLVGTDLSFRPYFENALANGAGRFYTVGNVSHIPGYYIARRIDTPDGPIGVAVTKINLGEIEANWWRSGELIAIVDNNNVVILSTRPDWRYRPLQHIAITDLERIAAQRPYGENGFGEQPIATDIWPSRGSTFALLASTDPDASGYFLIDELRLPAHQWRIVSLTPIWPLVRASGVTAIAAVLGLAAGLLVLLLWAQRRRIVAQRLADHQLLEQRIAERTEDLYVTNEALRAEIAERIRAEKAQRETQESLVQAAKLASLGQALAGVAHEVSQPVAALTTHLASAKLIAARDQNADIGGILGTMDKVVDRLAALTGHLKTFARKETQVDVVSDLNTVVANALELLDHKLRNFGIDVEYRRARSPLRVRGNPVHLEQVLINLLSNAADAMEHAAVRILSISIASTDGAIALTVTDTGTGIAPAAKAYLFDPFYTTKDAGRGLGLGLSISYGLVRDMGGSIDVSSKPGKGSSFTIRLLPAAAHTYQEAAQ